MRKIYCCEEHVEYGLEEIINDSETPPTFQRINKDELPTITCEYCGQLSVYIVSN